VQNYGINVQLFRNNSIKKPRNSSEFRGFHIGLFFVIEFQTFEFALGISSNKILLAILEWKFEGNLSQKLGLYDKLTFPPK
jgi:hypothetical protein